MYRLIISLSLLASISIGIRAQKAVDFNTINRESYRLYLAGEWDSLIVMGKQGIRQDMDFYYLRMRMGFAFYQKKNYRQATVHFKKALKFNQNAPAALEQLYYAHLMAGQAEEASLIRKKFKGDLALKLPPTKGKFADRLGAEYLYNKGLNDEQLTDPRELFEGLPPGVQYVNRHFSNFSLSLVNSITPGLTLAHAYSYLSKTNHFYYNDGSNMFDFAEQHVSQHQYYISPTMTTTSGFKFSPIFHLIRVHYQTPVDFVQGYQGGSSRMLLGTRKTTDFVGGLGLSKGIGSVELNLGGWISSLNEAKQLQNRLGLTWYPLGNLNLYAGAWLNSQYEKSERDSTFRLIPEVHLGFALGGKVWVDLSGAMGEIANYLENNGSIVYNSFSEIIHKKMVLSLSVPVSEKGSLLYLGGRWTENESRFYSFDPSKENTVNNIQYNTLSIYGGLSWKF